MGSIATAVAGIVDAAFRRGSVLPGLPGITALEQAALETVRWIVPIRYRTGPMGYSGILHIGRAV